MVQQQKTGVSGYRAAAFATQRTRKHISAVTNPDKTIQEMWNSMWSLPRYYKQRSMLEPDCWLEVSLHPEGPAIGQLDLGYP
jgi:hypothetical protein